MQPNFKIRINRKSMYTLKHKMCVNSDTLPILSLNLIEKLQTKSHVEPNISNEAFVVKIGIWVNIKIIMDN